MGDIEELKNKAAPSQLRIALAAEELIREQIITNALLSRVCDLKESQQVSDNDKHAMWIRQKQQSTSLNVFGIIVACSALYISVVGFDGDLVRHLYNIFK